MNTIRVNRIPRPTYRYLRVNESVFDFREPERLIDATFSDLTYVREGGSLPADFGGASPETVAASGKGRIYTIHIPQGEQAELRISVKTDEVSCDFAGQFLISLERESRLNLIWEFSGPSQEGILSVSAYYDLDEKSELKVSRMETGLKGAVLYDQRNMSLAKEAKADFTAAELGGEKIIVHSYARLEGRRCEVNERAFYAAGDRQEVDLYYHADHFGEESMSKIDVKGALFDQAKKVFRGTIDFKRGCAGSVGDEGDYAIQLSPETKNISLPLLLCTEDNVIGNHASSAGQLDRNTIYFLMSRGFSEEEARRIVVESLIRPLADELDPSLREEALSVVRNKLGAKEA